MYVITWDYAVRTDHVAEFEKTYNSNGTWAELFSRAEGYLGTELLRDSNRPRRYITIDRWVSSRAYHDFLAQWHNEYEAQEAQCKELSEQETLLGTWESVMYETR
jgi:heme-degrading monooxygenase HmoA